MKCCYCDPVQKFIESLSLASLIYLVSRILSGRDHQFGGGRDRSKNLKIDTPGSRPDVLLDLKKVKTILKDLLQNSSDKLNCIKKVCNKKIIVNLVSPILLQNVVTKQNCKSRGLVA